MVITATVVLFVSFFIMLFAGVPISAGIGIASVVAACVSGVTTLEGFAFTAAQKCFSGLDSFSLLALPFFSLGGNIMNKGGIARRLVRLARLLVGKIPGYLAATNVLANMFFGAVSGSSVAATSAMGSILSPLEKDEGYDPDYSAAVNICSAPTGILIPPSGPLILYSITAGGVSVAALFMGGYFVGGILGVAVAIMAIFLAVKLGYKKSEVKEEDSALKIWIDALPSLFAVIIVMGGILWGIFTATEAGAIAILYAIILGLIYGELSIKGIIQACKETVSTTGGIMLIVSAASVFSWVLTKERIPQQLTEFIVSICPNKYAFLIAVNIFVLIVGMFIEGNATMIVLVPLLAPIARQYGIDEIQFAMIYIFNNAIGALSPPMGTLMFVTCSVTGCKTKTFMKEAIPFYLLLVALLLLLTFCPPVTTAIVKLTYGG